MELIVRPLRDSDAAPLAVLAQDPEIQKLTLFTQRRAKGQALKDVFHDLVRYNRAGEYLSSAVLLDGEHAGYAMTLALRHTPDLYWMGSWVGAPHRRRGIATQARFALMQARRAVNVNAAFMASVRADNHASRAGLEKAGFVPVAADSGEQLKYAYPHAVDFPQVVEGGFTAGRVRVTL